MNYLKIFKEFFLYGIGGSLAFLINISLTYLFTEKLKIYYLISAILGYILSLILNFLFQSFITFKIKTDSIKRFLKFTIIQLTSLVIYSYFVYFFTDFFKIYYLVSVALSSLIIFFLNFTLSKFFAFKRS